MVSFPTKITNKEQAIKFVDEIDTFLIDCDGVIWHTEHVLDGVIDTLSLLKKMGKRVIFVTNNSVKSRNTYAKRFVELGFTFVNRDDIFCVSHAAAVYINKVMNIPQDKGIMLIGEEGMIEELQEANIKIFFPPENLMNFLDHGIFEDLSKILPPRDQIAAILVGFDYRFNYKKLAVAQYYLRKQDSCAFIATSADSSAPTLYGIYPGSGSIVSSITIATGRNPILIGKPETIFLDCIKSEMHIDSKRTCMIGDRLDTDIPFGIRGGLKTLLVLTGVSSEQDLDHVTQENCPLYYMDALGGLFKLLQ